MTPFDENLAVRGTTPTTPVGTPMTSDPAGRVNAPAPDSVRPRGAVRRKADVPQPVTVPLPRGTGGGHRPLTLRPRALVPLLVLAVAVLVTGVVLGDGLLLAAGLVLAGTVVNLIGKPRS